MNFSNFTAGCYFWALHTNRGGDCNIEICQNVGMSCANWQCNKIYIYMYVYISIYIKSVMSGTKNLVKLFFRLEWAFMWIFPIFTCSCHHNALTFSLSASLICSAELNSTEPPFCLIWSETIWQFSLIIRLALWNVKCEIFSNIQSKTVSTRLTPEVQGQACRWTKS